MKLLDLFRRKAKPATQEIKPDPVVDNGLFEPMATVKPGQPLELRSDIVEQLKAMFGPSATIEVIGPTGIKPPADPEIDRTWTWEAWAKECKAMGFPGWSPCRFAHRMSYPGQIDHARFVFGLTRGCIGIWRAPFDVCGQDEEGDWQQRRDILACLTHLPSGMGMGIFGKLEHAALAADSALRACRNLEDVPYPSPEWDAAMTRAGEVWKGVGIIPSHNAHAHDPLTKSGPYMILGLIDQIDADKPEKLS